MRPDDREEAVSVFLPAVVDVDVRGLDDFAALLRGELNANLKPGKERIAADHRQGVGFGAGNPSGHMQAARMKYFDCLNRALENLTAYVDAAEILITAAGTIAERYRGADTLSEARQREVEEALGQAMLDAARSRESAVEAIRQAHLERKIAGLDREEPR